MSETTTWKNCCECRRRFAFYAEIDKSRCYECELKRKAYREGYEAFRREMHDGLMQRSNRLRLAGLDDKAVALDELLVDMAAGAFPPKPKEGT